MLRIWKLVHWNWQQREKYQLMVVQQCMVFHKQFLIDQSLARLQPHLLKHVWIRIVIMVVTIQKNSENLVNSFGSPRFNVVHFILYLYPSFWAKPINKNVSISCYVLICINFAQNAYGRFPGKLSSGRRPGNTRPGIWHKKMNFIIALFCMSVFDSVLTVDSQCNHES